MTKNRRFLYETRYLNLTFMLDWYCVTVWKWESNEWKPTSLLQGFTIASTSPFRDIYITFPKISIFLGIFHHIIMAMVNPCMRGDMLSMKGDITAIKNTMYSHGSKNCLLIEIRLVRISSCGTLNQSKHRKLFAPTAQPTMHPSKHQIVFFRLE